MRVLCACEESQAVTIAFRNIGHEAYSCDILPCSGGHPEWHMQGDVLTMLDFYFWDLIIAFPPCTHLAVSGAAHFAKKRADGRQQQGIDFFMEFTKLKCKWAIENPVGIMSKLYRKPDQIIQPYNFGHDVSKKTCLWLNGLPLLKDTKHVPGTEYINKDGKKVIRWGNQSINYGQDSRGPSKDRSVLRSKTYHGIALAMASQWGK